MKSCPKCKSENVKPRTGTLGEAKGVWCADCGHASMTVAEWENAPRNQSTSCDEISVDMSRDEPVKPWNWPVDGDRLENLARNYRVSRNPGESDASLSERVWTIIKAHLTCEDNAIGL